jgi:hypothetical protein
MSIASYLSQLLNSSGLVPGTKIASGAIGLSQLTATGTPSSSNFLRGDNTWAAAGTGTVTSVATNNGLTGGTITSTGTLGLNLSNQGGVGCTCCYYAFAPASSVASLTLNTTYAGSSVGQAAAGGTWRVLSVQQSIANCGPSYCMAGIIRIA